MKHGSTLLPRMLLWGILMPSIPIPGLILSGMLLLSTILLGFSSCAEKDALTVSAASSLTFALRELGPLFEKETGIPVVFNFASTGQLSQQIDQGAPVDLFLAADTAFIDELVSRGLIIPESRQIYARGHLTLWTKTSSRRVRDLRQLTEPQIRLIALANPDHAPYGRAARQALEGAGIWKEIQYKLVLGENVRQALQYAETGNVDVALLPLSLSCMAGENWSRVPQTFYKPILQAMGIPASAGNREEAQRFADYVLSPRGQLIMKKYGFDPAPEEGSH